MGYQTRLRNKHFFDFSSGASGKESVCQCRRLRRRGFDPWVGKISGRRKWQPILVFLLGESLGQRSLAGYSRGGANSGIGLSDLAPP